MSSNTTTNGQSTESPAKADAKPAVAAKAEKGGLAKAESQAIVLEDNTRLIMSNTLPNNRPITALDPRVIGTLTISGSRPIGANSFEISTIDTLPGHRPIGVSTLDLYSTDMLPGHRPIASNQIDEDPGALMGYLD